jgi:hypothetical protein
MDKMMTASRLAIVVALGLLLLGCVGTQMENAMQPFIGQNVSAVVSKLGYPTDKREMLGHTIYTWKTGNPQTYYCNLDVVVDASDNVTSRTWDGNNGGCAALASRLR